MAPLPGEILEPSEHGLAGCWPEVRWGAGRMRFDLALLRRLWHQVLGSCAFANLMSGEGGSILGSGLFSLARIQESKKIRAGRCLLDDPALPLLLRMGRLC